jgi:hypothetical protein
VDKDGTLPPETLEGLEVLPDWRGATLGGDPIKGPINHSPRGVFDGTLLPMASAALAELAFQRSDYSA